MARVKSSFSGREMVKQLELISEKFRFGDWPMSADELRRIRIASLRISGVAAARMVAQSKAVSTELENSDGSSRVSAASSVY